VAKTPNSDTMVGLPIPFIAARVKVKIYITTLRKRLKAFHAIVGTQVRDEGCADRLRSVHPYAGAGARCFVVRSFVVRSSVVGVHKPFSFTVRKLANTYAYAAITISENSSGRSWANICPS
jgi:hypothetical protein